MVGWLWCDTVVESTLTFHHLHNVDFLPTATHNRPPALLGGSAVDSAEALVALPTPADWRKIYQIHYYTRSCDFSLGACVRISLLRYLFFFPGTTFSSYSFFLRATQLPKKSEEKMDVSFSLQLSWICPKTILGFIDFLSVSSLYCFFYYNTLLSVKRTGISSFFLENLLFDDIVFSSHFLPDWGQQHHIVPPVGSEEFLTTIDWISFLFLPVIERSDPLSAVLVRGWRRNGWMIYNTIDGKTNTFNVRINFKVFRCGCFMAYLVVCLNFS